MTAKDLWTVSDGGKSVAILPGEQFAVFKVDGSVEIAKGPRAQPLAKGDRYAKLTKLSATPKQYFKITKAEGAREARVEHLSGPFTIPVLPPESGTSFTDPVTGDEYELNEKFFLKSESDGIVVHTVRDSSDPKEGLDRVVVMGPKCFMPAPNQFVEMHRWSSPVERYCEKTKQTIPGAPLEFAEFSTVVQSMEITIPEVMEGGRKYNITTEMKIELDKKFWENENRPDDPIREIKAALRKAIQDYQKNGGSILKKAKAAGSRDNKEPAESDDAGSIITADVSQDTHLTGSGSASQDIDISLGGAIFKGVAEGLEGILAGVSEIVGKAIEAIPAVKTHLEVLQELQLQQQLAIETSLQMSIANQEVALAGQYAMSQNAVNTVKQLTEIETQAMVDLAGCAKGSGGNDRARSRVAACCCCSVASKVSGSVWADVALNGKMTGNGNGSNSVTTDVTNKILTSMDGSGSFSEQFAGNLNLLQSGNGSGTVKNTTNATSDVTVGGGSSPAPAPAPAPCATVVTTTTYGCPCPAPAPAPAPASGGGGDGGDGGGGGGLHIGVDTEAKGDGQLDSKTDASVKAKG